MGLAAMRQQQWRLQDSIRVLSEGIVENRLAPGWVMPTLLLRRGNNRALLVNPAAREDAQRVRADNRWKDWHKTADEQLAWIDSRRRSGEDTIYAALIPGNRLAADRRWDEAAAAYESVRQQHPNDVQVRYRLAQLRFPRGDPAGSVSEFTSLAGNKSAPAWIRAQSLLFWRACTTSRAGEVRR